MSAGPTTPGSMPPVPDLFFDSSALVAGVLSKVGAARALLLLSEARLVRLTVSEQVITETERALARKSPAALPYYRAAVRQAAIRIVADPARETVQAHLDWIGDPTDVPILVAAMEAGVDYLVTLNRRHFLTDPTLAERSRLRLGTPGDALAWVRGRLASEEEESEPPETA